MKKHPNTKDQKQVLSGAVKFILAGKEKPARH
jgi:hypothetical protein